MKDVARAAVVLLGLTPSDVETLVGLSQENLSAAGALSVELRAAGMNKGGNGNGGTGTPRAPRAALPPGRKRAKRRGPFEMAVAAYEDALKSKAWHEDRKKPVPAAKAAILAKGHPSTWAGQDKQAPTEGAPAPSPAPEEANGRGQATSGRKGSRKAADPLAGSSAKKGRTKGASA